MIGSDNIKVVKLKSKTKEKITKISYSCNNYLRKMQQRLSKFQNKICKFLLSK